MSAWVAPLAGAAAAGLLAPGVLRALRETGWVRANWRGEALAFPGGAAAVVAGALALGALAACDRLLGSSLLGGVGGGDDARAAAVLVLGVALLGLLDDLLEGAPRGWRGHGAALLRGSLSTGVLKALGTLALAALVLAGQPLGDAEYVLAVAVVVVSTNAFNLLDLRPGRSAKAFLVLAAALLIGTGDTGPLRALGAWGGALLVLGAYDLRERCMLGDTGSNALGALAGLWLVLALDTTGQAIALGLLVALTIFGEFRSISATIERLPPLRSLDCLGRKRHA